MVRLQGSLEVTEAGFVLPVCDFIGNVPTDTTDVFTFRTGGSGGVVKCVVTVVYTDDTRTRLLSATRVPVLG